MVVQPMRELPTLTILFFCVYCQNVVNFLRLWLYVQLLCDHWQITAVTAQYANKLEAES
jgi:hypothetical protein